VNSLKKSQLGSKPKYQTRNHKTCGEPIFVFLRLNMSNQCLTFRYRIRSWKGLLAQSDESIWITFFIGMETISRENLTNLKSISTRFVSTPASKENHQTAPPKFLYQISQTSKITNGTPNAMDFLKCRWLLKRLQSYRNASPLNNRSDVSITAEQPFLDWL
jgi:hypothetical protein